MAEKDKHGALKTYNELLEYQFEPLSIIGLLESQFRLMYQSKVLYNEGLSFLKMGLIMMRLLKS